MARSIRMTGNWGSNQGRSSEGFGSDGGRPSIILAAIMDDVGMLEASLVQGQDINHQDKTSGKSALHFAAAAGSVNFIRRAVQEDDLEVRVYDNDGLTPFAYASERADGEIKSILYRSMFGASELPNYEN